MVFNVYLHLTSVDWPGSYLQVLIICMSQGLISVSVLCVRTGMRRVHVLVTLDFEVVWSHSGWKWHNMRRITRIGSLDVMRLLETGALYIISNIKFISRVLYVYHPFS